MNLQTPTNRTALTLVSQKGHLDIVNALIAAGKMNRKAHCSEEAYALYLCSVPAISI